MCHRGRNSSPACGTAICAPPGTPPTGTSSRSRRPRTRPVLRALLEGPLRSRRGPGRRDRLALQRRRWTRILLILPQDEQWKMQERTTCAGVITEHGINYPGHMRAFSSPPVAHTFQAIISLPPQFSKTLCFNRAHPTFVPITSFPSRPSSDSLNASGMSTPPQSITGVSNPLTVRPG